MAPIYDPPAYPLGLLLRTLVSVVLYVGADAVQSTLPVAFTASSLGIFIGLLTLLAILFLIDTVSQHVDRRVQYDPLTPVLAAFC